MWQILRNPEIHVNIAKIRPFTQIVVNDISCNENYCIKAFPLMLSDFGAPLYLDVFVEHTCFTNVKWSQKSRYTLNTRILVHEECKGQCKPGVTHSLNPGRTELHSSDFPPQDPRKD